jgi:predicted small lipoprotein YifL
MRFYLSCLGLLLGLLACGIKGPPRPPQAQADSPPVRVEAGAFEEGEAEGEEPSLAEETLPFEEELR